MARARSSSSSSSLPMPVKSTAEMYPPPIYEYSTVPYRGKCQTVNTNQEDHKGANEKVMMRHQRDQRDNR
eukprot:scaffold111606_cov32-Prasinocladus_malaysianus.AAC.1